MPGLGDAANQEDTNPFKTRYATRKLPVCDTSDIWWLLTMNSSLFLAYGVLLTAASGIVYLGSMASLHTPVSTKALRKQQGLKETDDDEDDLSQGVSSEGAWVFPLLGSSVLVTLFLAFKYLDKDKIVLLVNGYFALAGSLVIPSVLIHLYKMGRGAHSLDAWTNQVLSCNLDLSWKGNAKSTSLIDFHMKWNRMMLYLLGVVIALMAVYLYTKHWILANVIAFCFAIQGMMLISLDTFKTGVILLGGLFLYDIFWVFGSSKFAGQSVMVHVATNFDGPIKILFPRNALEVWHDMSQHGFSSEIAFKFSLLGLGDIVVPGVFAALALAFDQHHASMKSPSLSFDRFNYRFNKPYFHACFAGYVLGLMMTMGVMHVFETGQPALLYLSPSCSLSVLLVAWCRGEWNELWSWVNPASQEPEKPVSSEAVKKQD